VKILAGIAIGIALTVTAWKHIGPWLWWIFTADQR